MRDLMIPTATMPDPSSENHAAAAWLAGIMNPAQRQEFETHLAGCAECQAEIAALRASHTQRQPVLVMPIPAEAEPKTTDRGTRRAVLIVIAALATLIIGFAIGWSVWQMAHR
ncbi:MAG TPA: zf-HC2 domain-containing protein [Steroidobacteraceae bacterium]|nr:zf-HC2 domain-containing protein [Steroidobacteraceae bacterium]